MLKVTKSGKNCLMFLVKYFWEWKLRGYFRKCLLSNTLVENLLKTLVKKGANITFPNLINLDVIPSKPSAK